jgi:hypothetical protein
MGKTEDYCTIHKALQRGYAEEGTQKSLFPSIFSGYVFYVRPPTNGNVRNFLPKMVKIDRKEMKKKFNTAFGN